MKSRNIAKYSYEAITYLLQTNSVFNLLLINVQTRFHIFGILTVQSRTITYKSSTNCCFEVIF